MSGTAVGQRTPRAGTESAVRVADVLLAIAAAATPVGVTALGRELGLSKAVVHRILQSLESRDLVRFDPRDRAYTMGPAAVLLGARAVRAQGLRATAMPVLRRLHHHTAETTTVSSLTGTVRIYLDQIASTRELKMVVEIGRPFPLHAGSSSKAILAFAADDLREHVLGGSLVALTGRTITDPGALRAELDRVRRAGVAVSRGERQAGAGSVAAPVFDPDGDVTGAISLCGPEQRFDAVTLRRYAPLVRRAAEDIGRALRGAATTPASAAASRG